VRYRGQELLSASARVLNTIRGDRIALAPEAAHAALDPSRPVGEQLQEVLRAHRKMRAAAANAAVLAALGAVHLATPEDCMRRFARELSPQACQRVVIAMALLCEPELLLLDEPTAALDSKARRELLSLLRELRERGIALLITTADLAVAAALADQVVLMQDGRVIEQGDPAEVFERSRHPYTVALLNMQNGASAFGEQESVVAQLPNDWLLEARALEAYDAVGRESLRGVSLALSKGESLGVVGESGSGAALLPEVLLQLVPASAGEVLFHGENLCELTPEELRLQRQYLQGIGPAPWASLDPLLSMLDVIEEPLRIFRPQTAAIERRERVYSMLGAIGLQPRHLGRFAHELSHEEALRVALARALILKPDVLVWSEPWAALDGAARGACSQLLRELRAAMRLTLLLVTHDWRDLRGHCEQILVLYAGSVVEAGTCDDLFGAPLHPYTRALIDAAPVDPMRVRGSSVTITPPSLALTTPPIAALGCAFRQHCPHAIARCETETPLLLTQGARRVACHRADELSH
jgi:microcin C transport system ATP-binding protein